MLMKSNSFVLCLVSILVVAAGASSVVAGPKSAVREFRPLLAKSVRIEVAAAAPVREDSADSVRQAWDHFDRGEWEKAMDLFLDALESNPRDVSAAEGLTMTVYRSGDRASAAEIAEELSFAMPWIRGMVAEAVLADVRSNLDRGEIALACNLADSLPYGGGAYGETRSLVEGALAESSETSRGAVAAAER